MDGDIKINSVSIISSVVVVIAYFVCDYLISQAYQKRIKKNRRNGRAEKPAVLIMVGMRIIRALLLIISIALFLKVNGIALTTLAAFLSIISAIIGLAIQDMLKDVVNGVHLVHDDYFAIGDTIIYQDKTCLVTAMSFRSVTLLDIDTKDTLVISNRNIEEVIRRSKLHDINLPLSYEDDHVRINEVLKITCEHIRDIPGVDDCVYKGVHDFKDWATIYKIRFYCEPSGAPEIRRAALRVIQDDLKAAGIRIPYPQLDVHSKNGPGILM